jgi:predicted metal-dependent phosphoesterase TrpH
MVIARLFILAFICLVHGVTSQSIAFAAPGSKIQVATLERRIHLIPPGTNESRYVYVPFDVPPHTVRNTIDIGLFDARSTGSDTDPNGFRGWSGGRRSEFFVSRSEATPGYLPGELPAGKWRIILGLYQVAPAGVDVSYKIEIETDASQSADVRLTSGSSVRSSSSSISAADTTTVRPSVESRKDFPRSARWWSGDLHMHTVHSDGEWTIAELISSARSAGLDFIVITDHNTSSHHSEIDRLGQGLQQPLVLRGEEITTYGGHTNALGLPSGLWIDFRSRPGDTTRISSIAAQAHRSGALISINHPFAPCGGCAWSYDATARDFDAIEVWNGTWDRADEQALAMWDQILQSGRHITAIASSDSHRVVNPIGQPTTNVSATKLSQGELLDAIRRGRVYLSTEVNKPVVNVEAATGNERGRRVRIGDEIHLAAPRAIRFLITTEHVAPDATISLISNGQVVRRFLAKTDGPISIECRQDAYFRVEVRDKVNGMLALTNPIYVKIRKR